MEKDLPGIAIELIDASDNPVPPELREALPVFLAAGQAPATAIVDWVKAHPNTDSAALNGLSRLMMCALGASLAAIAPPEVYKSLVVAMFEAGEKMLAAREDLPPPTSH